MQGDYLLNLPLQWLLVLIMILTSLHHSLDISAYSETLETRLLEAFCSSSPEYPRGKTLHACCCCCLRTLETPDSVYQAGGVAGRWSCSVWFQAPRAASGASASGFQRVPHGSLMLAAPEPQRMSSLPQKTSLSDWKSAVRSNPTDTRDYRLWNRKNISVVVVSTAYQLANLANLR